MTPEMQEQYALGYVNGYRRGLIGHGDITEEVARDYHGNTPCIPPQVLAPMIDRIYLRAEAQAALADEMNPSKP